MSWYKKIAAFFVAVICIAVFLCACDDASKKDGDEQTDINYDDVIISECLGNVSYKGLTVEISEEISKEEALWTAILANADIKEYPEDKVDYYFNQEKQSYMYLVSGDEKSYDMLLKVRGITEDDMLADAKKMVAKDMIIQYIINEEGIALTDEEKERLFDKYVDKYVENYGYGKNHVTANMSDIIYESMLYDKTMEYLFTQNEFITK